MTRESSPAITWRSSAATAKARTVALLGELGWPAQRVVDCGDITGARATEGYLLLWLRMMAWAGGPHFNIAVQRSV